MTLEEAILHCKDAAESGCDKCAKEHKQLMEWLIDYRRLLKEENTKIVTRLDKAREVYPNDIVYSCDSVYIEILDVCPYYLGVGCDDVDERTEEVIDGRTYGCNGISCVECWNKEYKEDE